MKAETYKKLGDKRLMEQGFAAAMGAAGDGASEEGKCCFSVNTSCCLIILSVTPMCMKAICVSLQLLIFQVQVLLRPRPQFHRA